MMWFSKTREIHLSVYILYYALLSAISLVFILSIFVVLHFITPWFTWLLLAYSSGNSWDSFVRVRRGPSPLSFSAFTKEAQSSRVA